jgi:hypothetical protein
MRYVSSPGPVRSLKLWFVKWLTCTCKGFAFPRFLSGGRHNCDGRTCLLSVTSCLESSTAIVVANRNVTFTIVNSPPVGGSRSEEIFCIYSHKIQHIFGQHFKYPGILDDQSSRVRFPAGAGNFSLHYWVQNGSVAHSASYPVGTGALSLGVKRPGREVDHLPPSVAEVKNAWGYTSTPNSPSWRGA